MLLFSLLKIDGDLSSEIPHWNYYICKSEIKYPRISFNLSTTQGKCQQLISLKKMLDKKNMDGNKAQNMRLSIIQFFERRVLTVFEKFSVNVSPTTGEFKF